MRFLRVDSLGTSCKHTPVELVGAADDEVPEVRAATVVRRVVADRGIDGYHRSSVTDPDATAVDYRAGVTDCAPTAQRQEGADRRQSPCTQEHAGHNCAAVFREPEIPHVEQGAGAARHRHGDGCRSAEAGRRHLDRYRLAFYREWDQPFRRIRRNPTRELVKLGQT